MTEQESKATRGGILANRKREREKEEHLQSGFEMNEKKKKNPSPTVRISEFADKVITDLFYDKRHRSRADAVDEIIRVYLDNKPKE